MLLPLLTNALNSPDSLTRNQALYVLGCLGDGAETGVPYLIGGLQDKDPWTRGMAAQSLHWLGPKSRAAIPAMIEALQDSNGSPARVIATLGSFGHEAKEAIPALTARLTRTNQAERLFAAVALCQIDPGQTQAWTIVTNSLSQTNPPQLRWNAFTALSQIKPARPEFVPLLTEGARDPNNQTATFAIQALRDISRDAAVGVLLEKFDDSQVNTRLWAAGWILRLEPNHPRALTLLTDHLRTGEEVLRAYAVEQLGHAYAQARDVIALLRTLQKKDKDRKTREAAKKALERILRSDSNQKAGVR
jgi:HEAT repeat protein